MVITNHFVFLHYPKTGGTFCETHIEKLYRQTNGERLSNLLRGKPVRWCKNIRKHKGLHAVPRYARHLPLVTSIRNPYDRWVSQYEFQVYRKASDKMPYIDLVMEAYPQFPEVTFLEFINIINTYWNKVQQEIGKPQEERVGYYSAQFVGMFCARPKDILKLPKAEITADLVRREMAPNITFLKTHHLNQNLYDYLSQFNHHQADLEAILDSPKILPEHSGAGSLREDEAWKGYYTPEIVDLINDKESLIFDLFPEFEKQSFDESWLEHKRQYEKQTPLNLLS